MAPYEPLTDEDRRTGLAGVARCRRAMHRPDDETPPRDRSEAYLRWWDEHENELMEQRAIAVMEARP